LLLRLDREFKVRLPDRLIGDARSPRDLLEGVLAASPTVLPPATEAIGVALPEIVEPAGAATLLDVLAAHVTAHPERPHILLWRSDDVDAPITYGDLDRNARAIAHGLTLRGIGRGDRVALMLPTEATFLYTFFGVLPAGATPVPIYPPFRRAQVEDHLRRQAGILRNAEARLLVTDAEIRRVGGLLRGLVESLEEVVAFPSADPRTGTERLIVLAETRLTDAGGLAELQYKISEASASLLGLQPDEILLAPPRTVPKTSSGKIRRSAARALYEAGALGRPRRALWWQLLRLEAGALVSRCQRALRGLGGMAYAACWWLVVGIIGALTWLLVLALPRRRLRHAAVGAAARAMLRLTGTPLQVSGGTSIPDGPAILVVNHSSLPRRRPGRRSRGSHRHPRHQVHPARRAMAAAARPHQRRHRHPDRAGRHRLRSRCPSARRGTLLRARALSRTRPRA
jgi:hypothetical protein